MLFVVGKEGEECGNSIVRREKLTESQTRLCTSRVALVSLSTTTASSEFSLFLAARFRTAVIDLFDRHTAQVFTMSCDGCSRKLLRQLVHFTQFGVLFETCTHLREGSRGLHLHAREVFSRTTLVDAAASAELDMCSFFYSAYSARRAIASTGPVCTPGARQRVFY